MKRHHFAVLIMILSAAGTGLAQQSVTLNSTPSRAVGQPQLFPLSNLPSHSNPNLVEGRELYSPYGIAFDTSASPPIIYVADAGNNRVLAWKNARGFHQESILRLFAGCTLRRPRHRTEGPVLDFSPGAGNVLRGHRPEPAHWSRGRPERQSLYCGQRQQPRPAFPQTVRPDRPVDHARPGARPAKLQFEHRQLHRSSQRHGRQFIPPPATAVSQ